VTNHYVGRHVAKVNCSRTTRFRRYHSSNDFTCNWSFFPLIGCNIVWHVICNTEFYNAVCCGASVWKY